MRNSLIIAVLFTALSACSNEPPKKLAESTAPQEQQETLRLACLNEAEYTTNIKEAKYQQRYGSKRIEHVSDTAETKQLKSLCRKMQKPTASNQEKILLAKECGQIFSAHSDIQHATRFKAICKRMTGETIQ